MSKFNGSNRPIHDSKASDILTKPAPLYIQFPHIKAASNRSAGQGYFRESYGMNKLGA
jgi:hypothetical protein